MTGSKHFCPQCGYDLNSYHRYYLKYGDYEWDVESYTLRNSYPYVSLECTTRGEYCTFRDISITHEDFLSFIIEDFYDKTTFTNLIIQTIEYKDGYLKIKLIQY